MVEMGLNLENCELWFERAVLVTLIVAVILVAVRVRSSYPAPLHVYRLPPLYSFIFF